MSAETVIPLGILAVSLVFFGGSIVWAKNMDQKMKHRKQQEA
ncbi:hypothetical protein [Halomonas sp. I5-271120]|nr:hypothetical protein [Halomonas sp. I5-271120]